MVRPTRWLAAMLAVVGLGACGGGTEFELVGTVERTTLELAAPVSEVVVEIPALEGRRKLEDLEIQYANVIPMLFFGVLLVIWIGGGGILGDVIYGIVRFLLGI